MTDAILQRMKAHCPSCNKETNCDVAGAVDQPWEVADEENSSNGRIDHKLLQCLGCETVFYHRSSWDSEDWDFHYDRRKEEEVMIYPTRTETYPVPQVRGQGAKWFEELWWIDQPLYTILREVNQAAESNSFFLAAVGLRTALDRTMELLDVDPGHYLADKLKTVKDRGIIGQVEHDALSVVAEAGNAAAHQGWSPSKNEFSPLRVALDQFVERTVVYGNKAMAVKGNIPPKHKRPRKAKGLPNQPESKSVVLGADDLR